MNSNPKIRRIRELYPEKKDILDLLMAKDPEFFTLCEDYDTCLNALKHWSESQAPEAETRVSEYRTLLRELQEEILQTLEAKKP
jgi:hypothetical protein